MAIFNKTSMGLKISSAVIALSLSTTVTATRNSSEKTNNGDDIVVTGPKAIKKVIARFIDSTIATPKGGKHVGQFARFTGAVCPSVKGLSEKNNLQIEERMRNVALASDIAVGRKDCAPNVHVNIVADGAEALSLIRKKRSDMFVSVPLYKRDLIAKSGGPAYSWKRLDTISAESNAVQHSGDVSQLPTADTNGQSAKTYVPVLYSNVKSRIKKTVKQQITRSFLLIEKDALVGLTTVQIADYAAMRSFIESEQSANSEIPSFSILSLFDDGNRPGDGPESVSELDLALLSSLYNSPSDVSASMQSSAMIHKMNKELTVVRKED